MGRHARRTTGAADRDRDPRAAAHAAPDTRADPQIPQSVSRTSVSVARVCRTSPNTEGSPVRFFPVTARHRLVGGLRGRRAGGRRAGRPRSPTPTTLKHRAAPASRPASARPHQRPRRVEHADCAGRPPRLDRARGRAPSAAAHELRRRAAKQAAARLATGRCRRSWTPRRRASRRARPTWPRASRRSTTSARSVTDTITSIYEEGDPQLLAFSALLDAQSPGRPDPARWR